jgi:hypothetical protein
MTVPDDGIRVDALDHLIVHLVVRDIGRAPPAGAAPAPFGVG